MSGFIKNHEYLSLVAVEAGEDPNGANTVKKVASPLNVPGSTDFVRDTSTVVYNSLQYNSKLTLAFGQPADVVYDWYVSSSIYTSVSSSVKYTFLGRVDTHGMTKGPEVEPPPAPPPDFSDVIEITQSVNETEFEVTVRYKNDQFKHIGVSDNLLINHHEDSDFPRFFDEISDGDFQPSHEPGYSYDIVNLVDPDSSEEPKTRTSRHIKANTPLAIHALGWLGGEQTGTARKDHQDTLGVRSFERGQLTLTSHLLHYPLVPDPNNSGAMIQGSPERYSLNFKPSELQSYGEYLKTGTGGELDIFIQELLEEGIKREAENRSNEHIVNAASVTWPQGAGASHEVATFRVPLYSSLPLYIVVMVKLNHAYQYLLVYKEFQPAEWTSSLDHTSIKTGRIYQFDKGVARFHTDISLKN